LWIVYAKYDCEKDNSFEAALIGAFTDRYVALDIAKKVDARVVCTFVDDPLLTKG